MPSAFRQFVRRQRAIAFGDHDVGGLVLGEPRVGQVLGEVLVDPPLGGLDPFRRNGCLACDQRLQITRDGVGVVDRHVRAVTVTNEWAVPFGEGTARRSAESALVVVLDHRPTSCLAS
ncbi:hypothetical protein SK571_00820 [Lentzea sp. BCCO 10_0798]|uniref:Uncharacterized protein n=1 Tax=Lentzea kristufekii TaxID=3095430 RepID=A0ABU4TIG5_9PSEU|nr:hypothetical protein [Lentzea sp. BCCO 10_0798]